MCALQRLNAGSIDTRVSRAIVARRAWVLRVSLTRVDPRHSYRGSISVGLVWLRTAPSRCELEVRRLSLMPEEEKEMQGGYPNSRPSWQATRKL